MKLRTRARSILAKLLAFAMVVSALAGISFTSSADVYELGSMSNGKISFHIENTATSNTTFYHYFKGNGYEEDGWVQFYTSDTVSGSARIILCDSDGNYLASSDASSSEDGEACLVYYCTAGGDYTVIVTSEDRAFALDTQYRADAYIDVDGDVTYSDEVYVDDMTVYTTTGATVTYVARPYRIMTVPGYGDMKYYTFESTTYDNGYTTYVYNTNFYKFTDASTSSKISPTTGAGVNTISSGTNPSYTYTVSSVTSDDFYNASKGYAYYRALFQVNEVYLVLSDGDKYVSDHTVATTGYGYLYIYDRDNTYITSSPQDSKNIVAATGDNLSLDATVYVYDSSTGGFVLVDAETSDEFTYKWYDQDGNLVGTGSTLEDVVGDWADATYTYEVYKDGELVATDSYYVYNETYVKDSNKVTGDTGDDFTLEADATDSSNGQSIDLSTGDNSYVWVDSETGETVSTDKDFSGTIGDWQEKTYILYVYDKDGNLIATTYYYIYNNTYGVTTTEETVTNQVGAVAKIGYFTYKVTKVATATTAGELTVTGVTEKGAKAKSLKVANTITSNSYSYKVTAIAKGALKGHKYLTSITIGKNVKTIGKKAFYNCKKLKKVTGGKGLVTIKAQAFASCKKLTTVKFTSKKLKTIGKKAFYNCKKLKKVTLKTTKLTKKSVKSAAFKGIAKKCTFKVPKKYVSSYKKIFLARGAKSTIKVTK